MPVRRKLLGLTMNPTPTNAALADALEITPAFHKYPECRAVISRLRALPDPAPSATQEERAVACFTELWNQRQALGEVHHEHGFDEYRAQATAIIAKHFPATPPSQDARALAGETLPVPAVVRGIPAAQAVTGAGPAGNDGRREAPAILPPDVGAVVAKLRELYTSNENWTTRLPNCAESINEENALIQQAADLLTRLSAEIALYHELLYTVAEKYDGETRHQTALRRLNEAHSRGNGEQAAMRATETKP